VQDDVIGKIISALSVELTAGEQDQISRIPTDNLEAYDYYLRAEQEGFYYSDVDTYRRTLSYYQRLSISTRFSDAHAGIARVAVDVWRNTTISLDRGSGVKSRRAAGRSLSWTRQPRAHTVLALLPGRRPHIEATDPRAAVRSAGSPRSWATSPSCWPTGNAEQAGRNGKGATARPPRRRASSCWRA
jgi:adenylate cyclase